MVHTQKVTKMDDSDFLSLMEDLSLYKSLATGRYLSLNKQINERIPSLDFDKKDDLVSSIRKIVVVENKEKSIPNKKTKSVSLAEQVKQLL